MSDIVHKINSLISSIEEYDERTKEIHTKFLWDIMEPMIDLFERYKPMITPKEIEGIYGDANRELPKGLIKTATKTKARFARSLVLIHERTKRKFYRLILSKTKK